MVVEQRETAKVILVQGDSILLCHGVGEPIFHLPGGGIERGETPERALTRELREEIGLRLSWARPIRTLTASWSPFGRPKDTVHEHMHLYAGQLESMGRQGIQRKEANLQTMWYPLSYIMPCEDAVFQIRPLDILKDIIEVGGQMMNRWVR